MQELVGFLTEGADLSRGPSGDYQEELDEQYGDDAGEMYGPSDGELSRVDEDQDGML